MPINGGRLARALGLTAAAAALLLTMATGCHSQQGETPAQDPAAPITSATKVAGAGVLGNQRRPDESCAPAPAPVDAGPTDREVRHAAGTSTVTDDPKRIVVLSPDQLDALCALGLQGRIVGAALPEGVTAQPSYLGTVIHDVAPIGSAASPDIAAIRAVDPDLILGSQAQTPGAFAALSAIAPTVFTGSPGAAWQDNLRTVGAATGRSDAVNDLVDAFMGTARQTGVDNDAAHFQASVVQLTDTTLRVYGTANFPGSVLSDVGLERPAAQRFTDKPYVEIGISGLDGSTDLSTADGDIVYVSFASPSAKDKAGEVLDSPAWRKLSATRDNRVFAVNNEVWQTGGGIVAARGILDDLRWVNAPIN